MKFLDLFSGIGGFRLGLERSGHTPVGYVEIDKFARQSYQAMYNTDGEWTAEDINKVTDEEWRKFNGTVELIAGGFPCQSFSIAGKREGFLNQTKGTLFFEVARAVKQIKPRFVFLENVKGLLNHDKGNTFRTILNTFDELGYDVEWRIYNSKDFGVPQNRERVYIIGHLRGDSGREVFPFTGKGRAFNKATLKQIGNISSSNSFGVREPKVAIPVLTPDRVNKLQNGRRFKENGDPSFTLTAQDKHGVMVKEATRKGYDVATVGDSINISQPNSKTRRGRVGHGIANTLLTGSEQATLTSNYRIRKLTPRECWRLQAFPDELFDKAQQSGLSDSQLYKQAGNSVTVNVIEYIGNLLKEGE
ncbi:DNA (cytosine-5-)-methyltransferase [Leuconostoc mesenteroides]|uniref:DNA (cytosine-5-)-methyltransferase n=1 Tax=Leuconostoc mesenteroides TaxID=1245 RepID=UPI0023621233|nr:DNA (cytosine-5-)-methyltransferase [Leuconostoc mesenteroides]